MYFLSFEFFFPKQDFDFQIIFFKFWILKFKIKDNFRNSKNDMMQVKIDMVSEELILNQTAVGWVYIQGGVFLPAPRQSSFYTPSNR